jgi:hypothetical protein
LSVSASLERRLSNAPCCAIAAQLADRREVIMSMSEYEERFPPSGTKIGRWFQTNSDFFPEQSTSGAKPAVGDATKSRLLPRPEGQFLMSAAKRHYGRPVTVVSTEHGTRSITARLVGARNLLRFCRCNPSSSAMAEVWQEEV